MTATAKQAKRETRYRAPETLLFAPPWNDGPRGETLVTIQPQGTFTCV